MVSRIIPVDDFDLVIFGATGDLARRKIVPGLYRRFVAGQMTSEQFCWNAVTGMMASFTWWRAVATRRVCPDSPPAPDCRRSH